MTTGATTHDVCIDRDRGIVVKRFRECRRGEPAREWSALTLLATFAPGLAPAPLGADLDADPPVITMSCLPEHISAWSDASLDTDGFLAMFDLSPAEQSRVRDFRRLAALFWLILLRPGSPASARNPSGTLERQADRLLNLFG